MQPTVQELKTIAYQRAYKENGTRRKTLLWGLALFLLVVLDVVLINSERLSPVWGFGVFIFLMVLLSAGNYWIRRKEKVIATRILSEG